MNSFKREDYIYLRYLEDDEDNCHKKGDIIRYNKEWLINELKGRRFNTCFAYDSLVWEINPDVLEDDIAFNKVYKSIIVADDLRGPVYLWGEDYLYLDEWLFSHLSPSDIDLVKMLKKEVLPTQNGDERMVVLKEGCPDVYARIEMHFKKGEIIDFSNPSVIALFYDSDWLKILAKTEVIMSEEKERLFQEDFYNAIAVQAADDHYFSLEHTKEHHYFKIKDGIKIKSLDELSKMLDTFLSSVDYKVVIDKNGFVTHICTVTSSYENSSREHEQIVLKIADKISAIEALEIHKKACADYVERQNAVQAKFKEEYEKEQQELDDIYQTKKNDPEIFPGVNGDFIHVSNEQLITKKRYTLQQIQGFYKNLKKLDPEVVKQICFYGGTLPYILNGALESRDFGDIDMFVPIEYMERLRKEFGKQESFIMLCDSKPYAEAYMLTTRIKKETAEIALQSDSLENAVSSLANTLSILMSPSADKNDYIDANGIVHNPFNVYKEDQLPYYRKIQDFGFKANLFGINISVFPIYEYKNSIMAKSFNIKEMYKFLLGVRVLDNTKIADFIRQVNIYGSIFNILPLEYTLASKQSAVEGEYAYRYEKDKVDIEYILAHKDELGINEEMLKEILEKYPDYSIAIAYELLNGNTINTLDGESYKQLVLTNRQLS